MVMKTLLMSYTQRLEYRVALPNDPTPYDVTNAIEKASQYLASGNSNGFDIESLKFVIEEK